MAKEYLILAVSVVTLALAGYAAFTVYGIENFQTPYAAADIRDYTSDFESIENALTEVTAKLEQLEDATLEELETTKAELEKLKQSAEDLQILTNTPHLILELDQGTYDPSDSILITLQDLKPQQMVVLQLLDSSNKVLTSKNPFSDSTGKVSYLMQIPKDTPIGDYKIKATTNDGLSDTIFFKISDNVTPKSNEPISVKLTLELNKSSYNPGDVIQLTGVGNPGQSISAKLTNPNDRILSSHSTVSSEGTYTMILIIDSQAPTGIWNLQVSQGNDIESRTFDVTK